MSTTQEFQSMRALPPLGPSIGYPYCVEKWDVGSYSVTPMTLTEAMHILWNLESLTYSWSHVTPSSSESGTMTLTEPYEPFERVCGFQGDSASDGPNGLADASAWSFAKLYAYYSGSTFLGYGFGKVIEEEVSPGIFIDVVDNPLSKANVSNDRAIGICNVDYQSGLYIMFGGPLQLTSGSDITIGDVTLKKLVYEDELSEGYSVSLEITDHQMYTY